MRVQEIYNQLYAGKKMQLQFSSEYEAERFRVRMYQYKSLQDKALDITGLQELKDAPAFSFSLNKKTLVATILFKEKERRGMDFKVLRIIDEDDDASEISESLGNSKAEG